MQFVVKHMDGTRSAEKLTPGEGETIESHDPFVYDGVTSGIGLMSVPKVRPPHLSLAPDMRGSVTVFMTEQTHDGTLLFTYQAISAVTEVAEQEAAKRGGEWLISPVSVVHRIVHRKMPWSGDNEVMASNEVVIVTIQQAA